jgi:FO synthase subunit 1
MLPVSRRVTYSPAHTLVPTYECFNRCCYCNFRVDSGQGEWLSLTAAAAVLRSLQPHGIIEILLLSGEVHPQSPRRAAWFQRIYDLSELALSFGFLPHTNAGILSFAEMARLKTVNVSLGLMLEQMTPALLETVHRHAPSKLPDLRLQQLVWAGELQIPFTTGLLLGIGETEADRWQTLATIATLHQRYGHIQEVILQPYSPGRQDSWQGSGFRATDLIQIIHQAREILPSDITLQIPPNLISATELLQCLDAGARDLGGIGWHDEVNPDYPHPIDTVLAATLANHAWHLIPRLPVYPQHDAWLAPRLKQAVAAWRDRLLGTSLSTSSVTPPAGGASASGR